MADELARDRPKRRVRGEGRRNYAARSERTRRPRKAARVLSLARPDWFDERIDRARLMAGR